MLEVVLYRPELIAGKHALPGNAAAARKDHTLLILVTWARIVLVCTVSKTAVLLPTSAGTEAQGTSYR